MKIQRPSAALTVATAALAVALFGSDLAHAAGQITTSQLANNAVVSTKVANESLVGADIRNGSLTGSDLADRSVRGADLAPGAVPRSRLAPDAQTRGFLARAVGNKNVGTAGTDVVSVDVPAGQYLVTATVLLVNISPSTTLSATCGIVGGSPTTDNRAIDETSQRDHNFTEVALVELGAAGRLTLRCRTTAPGVLFTASQSLPSIAAVSLDSGSVTDSPSTPVRPATGGTGS